MAGIKGFYFRTHFELGHQTTHLAQSAGGVGHYVVGFSKVHSAAVKRTNLRQTFHDMGHSFLRANHICTFSQIKRIFTAAKDHISTHAGGQVKNYIDLTVTDAIRDLAIVFELARRCSRLRIPNMAVNNCSTRFGCIDSAVGNLLRAARHMSGPILSTTGSGHSTGYKYVFVRS